MATEIKQNYDSDHSTLEQAPERMDVPSHTMITNDDAVREDLPASQSSPSDDEDQFEDAEDTTK